MLIFQRFQAADAASDPNTDPGLLNAVEIDSAVFQSQFRRSKSELSEAIGATDILRIRKIIGGHKIRYFTGDIARKN